MQARKMVRSKDEMNIRKQEKDSEKKVHLNDGPDYMNDYLNDVNMQWKTKKCINRRVNILQFWLQVI